MKKVIKKGFTLIELLVVIAIIAILALIVLLALNPAEMARRSRDTRRLSELGSIRTAIDLALADNQTLSPTTGWVNINRTTETTDFEGLDLSKYLSVVPQDPVYESGSSESVRVMISDECSHESIGKDDISYQYASDGTTYVLRARMEAEENCSILSEDGNDSDYYETGIAPGLEITFSEE